MTIDNQILTALSATDIEALPDFDSVRNRFESGFASFVLLKKSQAINALIKDELPGKRIADNRAFVSEVIRRLPDEALTEKRYIFLSLNPALRQAN